MTVWKGALPDVGERRGMKRDVLLREAAAVFARQGVHGTSLADIAKNLGVTKAALYSYISSKHELLFQCHMKGLDVAFESLKEGRDRGKNGLEKLILAQRGYLERIIDEGNFYLVLFQEKALKPQDAEKVIARRDEYEHELRELVHEGIADGSIVSCNPKLVVFAFLGASNWVQKWFSPDGSWTGKQVSVAITEMIERALTSRPSKGLREDPRLVSP